MASHIPESDWRHFREVHRKLLEEFSSRSLAGIVRAIEANEGTAHEKYLKVYKLIHKHDEEMARAFDDVRRSTAVMQLGIMRRMKLLNDEDLSRFSEHTRTQVLGIASL
jgi:hypothetical protein